MKRFEVQAGSPAILRYVIAKEDDQTLVGRADVETVTYHVIDLDTEQPVTPPDGVDIDVADFMGEMPWPWGVDDRGYNGRVEVDAAYLPTGAKTYRLEVLLTPSEGSPHYLEHVELVTIKTYSA